MMLDDLLAQWRTNSELTIPPAEPIMLWGKQCRSVWLAGWGPAVPYGPVDHLDGHQNYGYQRLKGDPDAARAIPEAKDWPELQDLLIAINTADSPIESVGCAAHAFQAHSEATSRRVANAVRLACRGPWD
jgi:hypothetical protein